LVERTQIIAVSGPGFRGRTGRCIVSRLVSVHKECHAETFRVYVRVGRFAAEQRDGGPNSAVSPRPRSTGSGVRCRPVFSRECGEGAGDHGAGWERQLIEERCPDRTRLLLVAADTQAPNPQKCRRRTAGAFWWGQDKALNAQLTGTGMSTTVKTGLIAAAVGGVIGGVALVNGGDDGTKPPPGPGPNDPPNTGPNATSFNGTYTGNLTATTNTCDFAGAASIRGVLAVDAAGRGTWQKTHVNANVTFNFNVVLTVSSSTAASFQAATTLQVGTRIFNVSDAAAIAGNVMTITQMLTNTSGQACTVRYTGQLTKS
jgi:hypothetical protein